MELLYVREHTSCSHYEKGEKPAIECLKMHRKQRWNTTTQEHKIIMVCNGVIEISYGELTNKKVGAGEIFFLPMGYDFSSLALENTEIIIFRLRMRFKLCDCFSIRDLLQAEENLPKAPTDKYLEEMYPPLFLKMNEGLVSYARDLIKHISNGLKCTEFFEIKLKELFFLFRIYYSKRELLRFFYLFITLDADFTNFVFINHNKVKNVIELASLYNSSVSAFEKKFRRIFGISAGKWMKQQKGKVVYYDIESTEKSFKDISFFHGFSSPAHLSNFCKIQFGMTPGEIRELASKSKSTK